MPSPGSRSPTDPALRPPRASRLLAAWFASMWLGGSARAEACPDPAEAVRQAEQDVLAYYLGDAQTALDRVVEGLGCSGPVAPEIHRRYWQAQGMLWSFQSDPRWEDAIRASRARDAVWNDDYGDGPEYQRWAAAADEPAADPVNVALRNHTAELTLWVDGLPVDVPLALTPGLHLIQGGTSDASVTFARAFTAAPDAVLTLPAGPAAEPENPDPVVVADPVGAPDPVDGPGPDPLGAADPDGAPDPESADPTDLAGRCARGDSEACIESFRQTKDRDPLQRDCNRGAAASCRELAEADPYQADIWLWRACDAGDQGSCARVAERVRDPSQRQRALLRGCELGETELCVPARRKARGWGDRYTAHEVACGQGVGGECWRLGRARLRHGGRFDAPPERGAWFERARAEGYRPFRPVRVGLAAGAPFVLTPSLEVAMPVRSIALALDLEGTWLPVGRIDGAESLWLAGGVRVYARRLAEGWYARLGIHSARSLEPDPDAPDGRAVVGGEGVHLRLGVRERLGVTWIGFEVGAGSLGWPEYHEELKSAVGFSVLPFAAVSFGVSP